MARRDGLTSMADVAELALVASAESDAALSRRNADAERKRTERGHPADGVRTECGQAVEGEGDGVSSPLVSLSDQNGSTDLNGLTEIESSTKPEVNPQDPVGAVSGVSKPGVSTSLFPIGGRVSRTRAQELAVFEHWVKCWRVKHPRGPLPVLDEKRAKAIRDRISEGRDVETLQLAVEGIWYSPFHTGQNDREKTYTDIGLALRDSKQIETFVALALARREAREEERRQRDARLAAAAALKEGTG
jgi:hypothetical protein